MMVILFAFVDLVQDLVWLMTSLYKGGQESRQILTEHLKIYWLITQKPHSPIDRLQGYRQCTLKAPKQMEVNMKKGMKQGPLLLLSVNKVSRCIHKSITSASTHTRCQITQKQRCPLESSTQECGDRSVPGAHLNVGVFPKTLIMGALDERFRLEPVPRGGGGSTSILLGVFIYATVFIGTSCTCLQ